MAVIRGQRHTKNVTADVKQREIEKDVVLVQPNRSPFVTMLMALPSKTTPSVKFEHMEKDYLTPTVQVNGAHLAGDTLIQLDVGHAARVKLNTQIYNKTTLESYRVVDVNYVTDVIEVVRNVGDDAPGAAAIADNEVLILASEAQEEGVTFSDAISQEGNLLYNYTQEFETAVEMSWKQRGTATYTEQDWNLEVELASAEHKEKMERAYWFSRRQLVASGPNGKRVYYMGGLHHFIKSNSVNVSTTSGVLTKRTLDQWLRGIYVWGDSNRKVIFGSPFAHMVINHIADHYQTVEPSKGTLGLNISKVAVNGQVFRFVETQVASRLGLDDYLWCVDMTMVRRRILSANGMNFSVKWYKDVQANDLKGKKDVIHCDEGLQVMNANSHGILSGFSG